MTISNKYKILKTIRVILLMMLVFGNIATPHSPVPPGPVGGSDGRFPQGALYNQQQQPGFQGIFPIQGGHTGSNPSLGLEQFRSNAQTVVVPIVHTFYTAAFVCPCGPAAWPASGAFGQPQASEVQSGGAASLDTRILSDQPYRDLSQVGTEQTRVGTRRSRRPGQDKGLYPKGKGKGKDYAGASSSAASSSAPVSSQEVKPEFQVVFGGPDKSGMDAYLNSLIRKANKSIYMQLVTDIHRDVLDELIKAVRNGVNLYFLTNGNRSDMKQLNRLFNIIESEGLHSQAHWIYYTGKDIVLHDKTMIIDPIDEENAYMLTGSANFGEFGLRLNHEQIVHTNRKDWLAQSVAHWNLCLSGLTAYEKYDSRSIVNRDAAKQDRGKLLEVCQIDPNMVQGASHDGQQAELLFQYPAKWSDQQYKAKKPIIPRLIEQLQLYNELKSDLTVLTFKLTNPDFIDFILKRPGRTNLIIDQIMFSSIPSLALFSLWEQLVKNANVEVHMYSSRDKKDKIIFHIKLIMCNDKVIAGTHNLTGADCTGSMGVFQLEDYSNISQILGLVKSDQCFDLLHNGNSKFCQWKNSVEQAQKLNEKLNEKLNKDSSVIAPQTESDETQDVILDTTKKHLCKLIDLVDHKAFHHPVDDKLEKDKFLLGILKIRKPEDFGAILSYMREYMRLDWDKLYNIHHDLPEELLKIMRMKIYENSRRLEHQHDKVGFLGDAIKDIMINLGKKFAELWEEKISKDTVEPVTDEQQPEAQTAQQIIDSEGILIGIRLAWLPERQNLQSDIERTELYGILLPMFNEELTDVDKAKEKTPHHISKEQVFDRITVELATAINTNGEFAELKQILLEQDRGGQTHSELLKFVKREWDAFKVEKTEAKAEAEAEKAKRIQEAELATSKLRREGAINIVGGQTNKPAQKTEVTKIQIPQTVDEILTGFIDASVSLNEARRKANEDCKLAIDDKIKEIQARMESGKVAQAEAVDAARDRKTGVAYYSYIRHLEGYISEQIKDRFKIKEEVIEALKEKWTEQSLDNSQSYSDLVGEKVRQFESSDKAFNKCVQDFIERVKSNKQTFIRECQEIIQKQAERQTELVGDEHLEVVKRKDETEKGKAQHPRGRQKRFAAATGSKQPNSGGEQIAIKMGAETWNRDPINNDRYTKEEWDQWRAQQAEARGGAATAATAAASVTGHDSGDMGGIEEVCAELCRTFEFRKYFSSRNSRAKLENLICAEGWNITPENFVVLIQTIKSDGQPINYRTITESIQAQAQINPYGGSSSASSSSGQARQALVPIHMEPQSLEHAAAPAPEQISTVVPEAAVEVAQTEVVVKQSTVQDSGARQGMTEGRAGHKLGEICKALGLELRTKTKLTFAEAKSLLLPRRDLGLTEDDFDDKYNFLSKLAQTFEDENKQNSATKMAQADKPKYIKALINRVKADVKTASSSSSPAAPEAAAAAATPAVDIVNQKLSDMGFTDTEQKQIKECLKNNQKLRSKGILDVSTWDKLDEFIDNLHKARNDSQKKGKKGKPDIQQTVEAILDTMF